MQRIQPLERLDAPDEEQHVVVRRDADALARFVHGDGVKMAGIHAGRDDDDFGVVGLVEELELGLFGQGGGDDAVGHLQHAALAVDAVLAFHLGRAARDAVLHQPQGVEHVHHRHVPVAP